LRKGLKTLHSNSSVKKVCKREGKKVVEEKPLKSSGKEKKKERPREEHHHTKVMLHHNAPQKNHDLKEC